MFRFSWRKFVQQVRRQSASLRGQQPPTQARKSPWLLVEMLEERTLLTTAQWHPTAAVGGVYDWSTGANWVGGIAPTQPGDIAQFLGTIANPPTLDRSESVGEIDFNSASNVSILEPSGGNTTLTLDNTGFKANAIVNALITNSGTDTFLVPLANNSNTPLAATISGGTVQLNNTGGSNSLAADSTFTVSTGATLVVDAPGNTGSAAIVVNAGGAFTVNANADSIANMGSIGNLTVGGGSFSFIGSNAVGGLAQDSTLNVGTVTLNPGSSTITTAPGSNAGSVAITAAALVRNAGGTVDFLGNGLGNGSTNEILFTQAPTQQGNSSNVHIGILPYGIVNGGDFATYQLNNPLDPSITGIGAFNDYASSIATAHTGDTLKESSVESLTANTTINALLLSTSGASGAVSGTVGEAGFTLTLASGGLLDTAPAGTISGGTLAFGGPFSGDPSNEGIVMNGEVAGGLDVNYWENTGLNGFATIDDSFNQYNQKEAPLYTRIDPTINYPANSNGLVPSGTIGNPQPLPPIPGLTGVYPLGYSILGSTPQCTEATWSGYLNIITGGLYAFNMACDDFNQLFIDGQLVLTASYPSNSVAQRRYATDFLTPGLHAIEDQYQNQGGIAVQVLSYTGPDTNNGPLQVLPGAVNLSSPGLVSTGVLNLNSAVAANSILTFSGSGAGVFNLPNAQNYTGATYLAGGFVNVGTNNSLGTARPQY